MAVLLVELGVGVVSSFIGTVLGTVAGTYICKRLFKW